MSNDTFGSKSTLRVGDAAYEIHRLDALTKAGIGHVDRISKCQSCHVVFVSGLQVKNVGEPLLRHPPLFDCLLQLGLEAVAAILVRILDDHVDQLCL